MPKVDLKSVYRVTAKGRTYFYAWRGAGAPRLLSEPGTDAFVAELAAALEARSKPDPTRMHGLITAYRASADWRDLSEKTRASWSLWLDRIQTKFGQLRVQQFERPTIRPDIRRWRDGYKAKPRAADMGLQVLSRLMKFAVSEGMLERKPEFGIAYLYDADRSDVIWTAEDLATLEPHASPELMWAARLGALTGLRRSDLLRLSWNHVKGLGIEIRTGKSRERKTTLIPVFADLSALLAEIPRRGPVILTNTDGVPWRTGFGSSWGKATTRAGIEKHFHDLRGTFATRAYVAGLTEREIAEILTWSEDEVRTLLDRYVRRDVLLRDRIRRLEEHAARTPAAKPGAKPG